ncbi:MAG: phosphoribosylanthranilate isomerase [Nannocystis sp.]|nr:phosphoribosylanthranilate isomerase [Nannocystis sp.]MBA3549941.1 phosphoribosylanthranilate isomerase [Nannocystis sp.]
MTTKLKICGVTQAVDLAACVELGVDAVGINLWSGSRRGLSLAEAAALLRAAMPARGGPERIGVFVNPGRDELQRAYETLELDLVQVISDDPQPSPPALPYTWVIRGTPSLASLVLPSPGPARVLLDAAVAGYGGAGQTTDWVWARAALPWFAAPVWLAGGITPENAAAALAAVGPRGLDVASGSELSGAGRGEKDHAKISALLAACRASE